MNIDYSFINSSPENQNIIDLFKGEWHSKMPEDSGAISEPGPSDLFNDPRVSWASNVLGPFQGMDILELGPLEGAHSYMMERLGANSVTAIEANTRAFLKCLCVKEALELKRVRFKLGNFLPYLETCQKVDLIFASGVLYHMAEPFKLLDLLSTKADRVFIWTHYYDALMMAERADNELFAPPEPFGGPNLRGSRRLYPEAATSWKGFGGGPDTYAVWLERESLVGFLTERGFQVEVSFDHPHHPAGPALALCASRQGVASASPEPQPI
jgi:Protein of unknown function (DUF1698)